MKERESKRVSWLENKIGRIRSLARPCAARAGRFSALIGVLVLLAIVVYSLTLPKDPFQQAKEQILQNPNNSQAHLILAEEFLKNNQLTEAETELNVAQKLQSSQNLASRESHVLGITSVLSDLWNRWREQNPDELNRLMSQWEAVIAQTPTYRDAYLKVSYYAAKLGDIDKAKEYLQKAIDLDPNNGISREVEKLIQ